VTGAGGKCRRSFRHRHQEITCSSIVIDVV
jgi:hypothetical protein